MELKKIEKKSDEKTTAIRRQYMDKLRSLTSEVKSLKRQQREHAQLLRMKAQADKKLVRARACVCACTLSTRWAFVSLSSHHLTSCCSSTPP